ncbi:Holliday junction resolvase RecU [Amedibacillus sp. YH-ame10]
MVINVIGYPNRKAVIGNTISNTNEYAGRGMSLEHDLNSSNTFYMETERALIHKKPTPIQVVTVDYPARNAAKITEAYYKVPSTTDYNGIYRGRAIDFEAKETKSKTSFPFKSIHPHQITHLKRVLKHKGIGFFIIRFTSYDETYLVDANILITLYENSSKKSISYDSVKEVGSLIQQGLTPRLRYLDNVDDLYFKEEER